MIHRSAAWWIGTLSRTPSTLSQHVRPYQLLRKHETKVFVVHGWTTPDVIGVQNDGVCDGHVYEEAEDVLVVLHAFPSYVVAASKVVVVVDPTHVQIIQGNADGTLNVAAFGPW